MLELSPLVVPIVIVVIGFLILWSNPARTVNRVVMLCSLSIAAWVILLDLQQLAEEWTAESLLLLRLTYSAAALPALAFLLVKDAIVGVRLFDREWLKARAFWLVGTLALALIPFTDWFIPASSTRENPQSGWAWDFGYDYGQILLVGALFYSSIRSLKLVDGSRRIELQIWLIWGCTVFVAELALKALYRMSGDTIYIQLQPIALLAFYGVSSFIITTHRIFDSRQIFLVVLEKAILVGCVALAAYWIDQGLETFLPLPNFLPWVVTTAICFWIAVTLNSWLNRRFQFFPQATEARRAAFEITKQELNFDRLEQAFLPILRGWGDTDTAVVLAGPKDNIRGCGITLPPNSPMVDELRRIRWATPERLAREKTTPERRALDALMQKHRLGVLICSRGLSLTVLVGVGLPISRRPCTYPKVVQLLELTAIIESALERAHFSMKAQHAERLATVGLLGAGLAHEIRNPLVTIKTFVQLLPQRHQDPGFRDKFFQLITEEITRIDRLTEQLMDMASPRSYFMVPLPLHPLLRNTLELVEPRAADRQVEISVDLQASPDVIFSDAAAARQVLLNLCFNAIHALENTTGVRRIRIATRNLDHGIELSITDNGPGLSSEMIPRLFAPFQSTKSSGFGLGLAISGEIMSGLKGEISADPPEPGKGATFRLKFPCPQPSS